MTTILLLTSLWISPLAMSQNAVRQNSIVPQVSLGHSAVLSGQTSELYLLLQLDGLAQSQRGVRQKLNLALVIDRSGSMNERGKMRYAKLAARQLIESMASDDLLSIVAYDHQVNVMRKARPMSDKTLALQTIDRISPRGATNLAGGMVVGVTQAHKKFDPRRINRVILLSDGLTNQGVTARTEIAHLAQLAAQKGVTVTTLGMGLDYDEDLMQAIAQKGAGRYYYVQKPAQLAGIFREELNVMTTTIARDIRVLFHHDAVVKKVEVVGFPVVQTATLTTVQQKGLFAGEKRELLMRLSIDAKSEGPLSLGWIELQYNDLLHKHPVKFHQAITLQASADAQQVKASANPKVLAQAALLDAERQSLEAVRLYEAGNKQAARQRTRALAQQLSAQNAQWQDVKVKKKIDALILAQAQMDEADRGGSQRQLYIKKAKWISSLGTRGKSKGGGIGSYILEPGDNGTRVKEVQSALQKIGLYQGPIDGQYTDALEQAVRAYQSRERLDVDGVVGPMTLTRLGLY